MGQWRKMDMVPVMELTNIVGDKTGKKPDMGAYWAKEQNPVEGFREEGFLEESTETWQLCDGEWDV